MKIHLAGLKRPGFFACLAHHLQKVPAQIDMSDITSKRQLCNRKQAMNLLGGRTFDWSSSNYRRMETGERLVQFQCLTREEEKIQVQPETDYRC